MGLSSLPTVSPPHWIMNPMAYLLSLSPPTMVYLASILLTSTNASHGFLPIICPFLTCLYQLHSSNRGSKSFNPRFFHPWPSTSIWFLLRRVALPFWWSLFPMHLSYILLRCFLGFSGLVPILKVLKSSPEDFYVVTANLDSNPDSLSDAGCHSPTNTLVSAAGVALT